MSTKTASGIKETIASLQFRVVCPDLIKAAFPGEIHEDRVVRFGQAISQFRSHFVGKDYRILEDGSIIHGTPPKKVPAWTLELDLDEGNNVLSVPKLNSLFLDGKWELIFHRVEDQKVFHLLADKKAHRFYFRELDETLAAAMRKNPLP